MAASSLLLVGLGNPGPKHARQRHNVGFMAVDAIADVHGFSAPRTKFQSELREGWLDGPSGRIKAWALKPQNYMNLSGQAVGEAMRFFKLTPADIVVFHDELDLAAGKIKAKAGGGLAGHNGLKSIDEHIGPDFRRVRIGIGHPGEKSRVTGHVLGDFSKADQDWLAPLLAAMAAASPALADGDARFSSAVALRLNPPKSKTPPPAAVGDASAEIPEKAGRAEKPASTRGPFDALGKLFSRRGGGGEDAA